MSKAMRYFPICDPCVEAIGQECHTPGCALWMHAVDIAVNPALALEAGAVDLANAIAAHIGTKITELAEQGALSR